MAEDKKSIFDFEDKFGVKSPFGNWMEESIGGAGSSIISASGYWSSDEAGKNAITTALLGETVYFHLSTKRIPANKSVRLKLYDSDSPFGKTDMSFWRSPSLSRNGMATVKVELSVKWGKYIGEDTGYAIELFWILEYGKNQVEIPATLNVYEDEYYTAIINDRYRYSCNCGWIDKTHAFETTKRNRSDIGAKNLWKQIVNETGTKSNFQSGFKVVYTQDAKFGPVVVGTTNRYFVKSGLPLDVKERIALAIFQEVSMAFEQQQALGVLIGKGASSYEPADLVSNLLGFYKVVRPELTRDVILKKCKVLDKDKSLQVYTKYPGAFTLPIYKNEKFTPRFFDTGHCSDPVFPKEFQQIKPFPKDNNTFRDWDELFDIHKGVPPMTGPKF